MLPRACAMLFSRYLDMSQREPVWRRRTLVAVPLALWLGGAAVTTWTHARQLADQAPMLAHWPDLSAQRRLLEGDELVSLVALSDAVLPHDATVLLVTAGEKPRAAEYVIFHRILYHLAPRRVWWTNRAVPDGTWESRFWIPAPLEADRLRTIAAAKGAGFLIFAGVDVPRGLPPGTRLTSTTTLVVLEGFAARTIPAAAINRPASPLGVIAALLIALLAGAAFLNQPLVRRPLLASIEGAGLAWTLGVGLLTVGMFWLNNLGARLNVQLIVLSTMAVTLWLVSQAASARRTSDGADDELAGGSARSGGMVSRDLFAVRLLLLAMIAFEVAYVVVMAVGRPLVVWDSWATWGMKARAIFVEGAITPSVFADPSRVVTHLDYPLLVPLTQVWELAWALPAGNPVDDRLAGVPAACFFAALLAIFCGSARRAGATRIAALAGTAFLASIDIVSGTAAAVFADVPLSVYALTAAVFGCRWIQDGGRRHFLIAAAAGGLLPWTKREGLVLLIALCASLLFAPGGQRRKLAMAVGWGAATIVLVGGWWATLAEAGVADDVFLPVSMATLADTVDRLPRIIWLAGTSLLALSWSLFWVTLPVLAIVTSRWAHRRTDDVLVVSALLYLALMTGVYLFSDYAPYGQHVVSSFPRLALHVTPAALLWAVLRVSRWDHESRTPDRSQPG